jgi:hypothetical protein
MKQAEENHDVIGGDESICEACWPNLLTAGTHIVSS